MEDEENPVTLIAESVGGGDILIREILGYKTEISGNSVTMILRHKDIVGTLSKITGTLSQFELNILSIRSKDIPRKNEALTTIEIEQKAPEKLKEKLMEVEGMQLVRILPKITEGEEMF